MLMIYIYINNTHFFFFVLMVCLPLPCLTGLYQLSILNFGSQGSKASGTWHWTVGNFLITMGRHGKKKAKMVMMPQMMMMPQCQQDDSSDEDERTPRHDPGQGSAGSASASASDQQHSSLRRPGAFIKDEGALITKSATFVRGLPRTRLSESLEALHETLDATMTSELDMDGLLICLWIFTRVRPNQRVCDLRHLYQKNAKFWSLLPLPIFALRILSQISN